MRLFGRNLTEQTLFAFDAALRGSGRSWDIPFVD